MQRRSRTLAAAFAACCLAAALPGCKRAQAPVDVVEEPAGGFASILHTADPATASQLLKGFHDVEQNSFRWTMKEFSVSLRPPAGAAGKGATLRLNLWIPDALIQQAGAVTLTARIGRLELPAETYKSAGLQVFTRPVPASMLAGDAVVVEFSLDKTMKAAPPDQRELGIVVSAIGFEPK